MSPTPKEAHIQSVAVDPVKEGGRVTPLDTGMAPSPSVPHMTRGEIDRRLRHADETISAQGGPAARRPDISVLNSDNAQTFTQQEQLTLQKTRRRRAAKYADEIELLVNRLEMSGVEPERCDDLASKLDQLKNARTLSSSQAANIDARLFDMFERGNLASTFISSANGSELCNQFFAVLTQCIGVSGAQALERRFLQQLLAAADVTHVPSGASSELTGLDEAQQRLRILRALRVTEAGVNAPENQQLISERLRLLTAASGAATQPIVAGDIASAAQRLGQAQAGALLGRAVQSENLRPETLVEELRAVSAGQSRGAAALQEWHRERSLSRTLFSNVAAELHRAAYRSELLAGLDPKAGAEAELRRARAGYSVVDSQLGIAGMRELNAVEAAARAEAVASRSKALGALGKLETLLERGVIDKAGSAALVALINELTPAEREALTLFYAEQHRDKGEPVTLRTTLSRLYAASDVTEQFGQVLALFKPSKEKPALDRYEAQFETKFSGPALDKLESALLGGDQNRIDAARLAIAMRSRDGLLDALEVSAACPSAESRREVLRLAKEEFGSDIETLSAAASQAGGQFSAELWKKVISGEEPTYHEMHYLMGERLDATARRIAMLDAAAAAAPESVAELRRDFRQYAERVLQGVEENVAGENRTKVEYLDAELVRLSAEQRLSLVGGRAAELYEQVAFYDTLNGQRGGCASDLAHAREQYNQYVAKQRELCDRDLQDGLEPTEELLNARLKSAEQIAQERAAQSYIKACSLAEGVNRSTQRAFFGVLGAGTQEEELDKVLAEVASDVKLSRRMRDVYRVTFDHSAGSAVTGDLGGDQLTEARASLYGDPLAREAAAIFRLLKKSSLEEPERSELRGRLKQLSEQGISESFGATFVATYGDQFIVREAVYAPRSSRPAFRTIGPATSFEQVLAHSAAKSHAAEFAAVYRGDQVRAAAIALTTELRKPIGDMRRLIEIADDLRSSPEAFDGKKLEALRGQFSMPAPQYPSRGRNPQPLNGSAREFVSALVAGDLATVDAMKLSFAIREEDEQLARSVYLRTTPVEQTALAAQTSRLAQMEQSFSAREKVSVEALSREHLDANGHEMLMNVRGRGELELVERIKDATLGRNGTDETKLLAALAEVESKQDAEELRKTFSARYEKDLDSVLWWETSGRTFFEAKESLRGRPQTLEELVGEVKRRHDFETSGWMNYVPLVAGTTVTDLVPGKRAMNSKVAALVEGVNTAQRDGTIDPQEVIRLRQLAAEAKVRCMTWGESKDMVADQVATYGGNAILIGGTAVVVIGTGFTSAPAIATLMGVAGASGAWRVGVRSGLKGRGYSEDVGEDIGHTAVSVGTVYVGGVVSRAASSKLMEFVGARALKAADGAFVTKDGAVLTLEQQGAAQLAGKSIIEGSLRTRAAHNIAIGALDGTATAPIVGGSQVLLNEHAYDQGLGEALKSAGKSALIYVPIGVGIGGGVGAAFSVIKPKSVARLLDQSEKERVWQSAVRGRVPARGEIPEAEVSALKDLDKSRGFLARQDLADSQVKFVKQAELDEWLKKFNVEDQAVRDALRKKLESSGYLTNRDLYRASSGRYDPNPMNAVKVKGRRAGESESGDARGGDVDGPDFGGPGGGGRGGDGPELGGPGGNSTSPDRKIVPFETPSGPSRRIQPGEGDDLQIAARSRGGAGDPVAVPLRGTVPASGAAVETETASAVQVLRSKFQNVEELLLGGRVEAGMVQTVDGEIRIAAAVRPNAEGAPTTFQRVGTDGTRSTLRGGKDEFLGNLRRIEELQARNELAEVSIKETERGIVVVAKPRPGAGETAVDNGTESVARLQTRRNGGAPASEPDTASALGGAPRRGTRPASGAAAEDTAGTSRQSLAEPRSVGRGTVAPEPDLDTAAAAAPRRSAMAEEQAPAASKAAVSAAPEGAAQSALRRSTPRVTSSEALGDAPVATQASAAEKTSVGTAARAKPAALGEGDASGQRIVRREARFSPDEQHAPVNVRNDTLISANELDDALRAAASRGRPALSNGRAEQDTVISRDELERAIRAQGAESPNISRAPRSRATEAVDVERDLNQVMRDSAGTTPEDLNSLMRRAGGRTRLDNLADELPASGARSTRPRPADDAPELEASAPVAEGRNRLGGASGVRGRAPLAADEPLLGTVSGRRGGASSDQQLSSGSSATRGVGRQRPQQVDDGDAAFEEGDGGLALASGGSGPLSGPTKGGGGYLNAAAGSAGSKGQSYDFGSPKLMPKSGHPIDGPQAKLQESGGVAVLDEPELELGTLRIREFDPVAEPVQLPSSRRPAVGPEEGGTAGAQGATVLRSTRPRYAGGHSDESGVKLEATGTPRIGSVVPRSAGGPAEPGVHVAGDRAPSRAELEQMLGLARRQGGAPAATPRSEGPAAAAEIDLSPAPAMRPAVMGESATVTRLAAAAPVEMPEPFVAPTRVTPREVPTPGKVEPLPAWKPEPRRTTPKPIEVPGADPVTAPQRAVPELDPGPAPATAPRRTAPKPHEVPGTRPWVNPARPAPELEPGTSPSTAPRPGTSPGPAAPRTSPEPQQELAATPLLASRRNPLYEGSPKLNPHPLDSAAPSPRPSTSPAESLVKPQTKTAARPARKLPGDPEYGANRENQTTRPGHKSDGVWEWYDRPLYISTDSKEPRWTLRKKPVFDEHGKIKYWQSWFEMEMV